MRLLQSLAIIFSLITISLAQQNPASPTPAASPNPQTSTMSRAAAQPSPSPTPLPPPTIRIDSYRASSGRIIGAALTSEHAYARLAHLTDQIGNRLSGSKGLERAIEWALAEMKRDGLDNVRFVMGVEAIFGAPDERLTIRHDAGSGAGPYIQGTLRAIRKVREHVGLVRVWIRSSLIITLKALANSSPGFALKPWQLFLGLRLLRMGRSFPGLPKRNATTACGLPAPGPRSWGWN